MSVETRNPSARFLKTNEAKKKASKMKGKIFIIIAVIAAVFVFLRLNQGGISSDYRRQIDSLRTEIQGLKRDHIRIMERLLTVERTTDTIKSELRTVQANTDTLKFGQSLIFDEVKKANDKSFWDLFKW